MAKRKVASPISKKIKTGWNEHRGDETNYGIVNLPGGISNGKARLTSCKFGKYAKGNYKGEDFWQARGVVIEPAGIEDPKEGYIPIEGKQTATMPIPICDTTKADGTVVSMSDNIARMSNELRLLGVDTEEVDPEDLEETMAALVEEGPIFSFSTSWRDENDHSKGAWENWHGVKGLEDYVPPDAEDVEVDEEEEEEAEEEPEEEEEVEEEEETEEEDEEEEEEIDVNRPDLDELAAFADDDGNEEAMVTLTDIAEAVGLDMKDYEEASWADLVEAIEEARGDEGSEDEEEEEEEEETITPEKGEEYWYKPPKKRKPVQCEVTAVFNKSEKVNLRDIESDEVYKSVPWDALSLE